MKKYDLYLIPPDYTGLLQPCDVGINKSLKDRLEKKESYRRRLKNTELAVEAEVPAPKRVHVLRWIKKIWHEFPVEIVENSF